MPLTATTHRRESRRWGPRRFSLRLRSGTAETSAKLWLLPGVGGRSRRHPISADAAPDGGVLHRDPHHGPAKLQQRGASPTPADRGRSRAASITGARFGGGADGAVPGPSSRLSNAAVLTSVESVGAHQQLP